MRIVSIDELDRMVAAEFFKEKDAVYISGRIARVRSASCTGCAMRRALNELGPVLAEHGLSLRGTAGATNKKKGGRPACLDCVRKHIMQAYVLQSEFFQGYVVHLALIEAHLTEALEECPEDAFGVKKGLQAALLDIIADKKPFFSHEVLLEEVDTFQNDQKGDDDDTLEQNSGFSAISNGIDGDFVDIVNIPPSIRAQASLWLDKASRRRDLPGWCGILAMTAEIVARYAPCTAAVLRNRRILFGATKKALKTAHEPYFSCSDVKKALDSCLHTGI